MRKHLLVLIAIVLSVGCGGADKPAVPPPAASVQLPSQSIGGFRLIETIMGKKSWALDADSANTFSEKQTVELFTLKVDFYKKAGDTVIMVLTSDKGMINTNTRDVEARERVVMVTRDSLKIFTDYVRWINKSRKLVTESHVRLEKGADWLVGDGMEVSPDGREVQLKRNVKGKKELLNFDRYSWE
ncbi:MAG: LPS export ABC transporter periplasmic protein LptC [Candidatus Edwardsbacteria bacterium]|nr:LPS export ABC transporter periplasmic protein LptC [Candidatus Edwardsbacteria bacterium]